jgi:HSP20 family protein
MSRSTASPPPNEASGPNGDRRASEATTTRVKPMRAARVDEFCWRADGAQERVVNVALDGRHQTNPHSNPWRCIAMLMQFDPFRDFDRLAEQLAAGARTPRPFPMDAYRRGDEFVVSFDLPGMAPGAIDLTVEQNVLTIKAERRFDGQDGDQVIAAERLHGAFTRQLFLGETLDAERLVASYETGVLTLRIPVAESAKPRKVQISEGADERTIEAQTTQASA